MIRPSDRMRGARRILLAGACVVIAVGSGLALYSLRARGETKMAGYMCSIPRLCSGAVSTIALSASVNAAPAPSFSIGMNVPAVSYYADNAPFTNLLKGSPWLDNWKAIDERNQDADGNILTMPAPTLVRFLVLPGTGPKGVIIECTFSGSGKLTAAGEIQQISSEPHRLRFRLINTWAKPMRPWVVLADVDAAAPPRDFECHESGVDPKATYRATFLDSLRGFSTLRFMDWQNSNENNSISWKDRRLPTSTRTDHDGVSIEDMLALADAVGADPWFVMPWNATDDYVRNFAILVKSKLAPNRKVYVEVGNEVWNQGFPVARQAISEGVQEKLSTSPAEAGLLRYAERSAQLLTIWERVFAGSSSLVRVASTQHVLPRTAEMVLGFRDTARHVDALATAPYFGSTVGDPTMDTADKAIAYLSSELQKTVAQGIENRAVAVRFGKRYVTYEGGQGLIMPVPTQADLYKQVERDPRMYGLYKTFIREWRTKIGDLLCLLTSTAPITGTGAWGLAEHEGQSPADAPKLRAVLEEIPRSKP